MNPIAALAALALTIEEIKEGPESAFYLPFMGRIGLEEFQGLLLILQKLSICKVSNHYVTFIQPTPGTKGDELLKAFKVAERAAANPKLN